MAYSPHTTNLPRRALVRFLGWIGASTIIGTAGRAELPPAPAGLEDAQLFARWGEYLKFEVELNRVEEARDVISWNARQAYPPKPDCIARFVATPARTLAGLALKTSAILYFDDRTGPAWRGLLISQEQLEPHQEVLLTLRRDLLRMANLPDDFALMYGQIDDQSLVDSI